MPLDFTSPYDELTELRSLLTTQEIAELTGLRRETISRARPDSRFQRRTEAALADLYVVVTRMRALNGGSLGQLAAILRRPQADFEGRSIADLLREGKVDQVLGQLTAPRRSAPATPDPSTHIAAGRPGEPSEGAVEAFLAGDPELALLLPEIEAKVREHFGGVEIERTLIEDFEPGEGDVFYLGARSGLSFDDNLARLTSLLEAEGDLLDPVAARLTIGFR